MKFVTGAVILAITAFALSAPCKADDSDDGDTPCIAVRDIYADALKDKDEIIKLNKVQIMRALTVYANQNDFDDIPDYKEAIVVVTNADLTEKLKKEFPGAVHEDIVYFIDNRQSCKNVHLPHDFLFFNGKFHYGKPV